MDMTEKEQIALRMLLSQQIQLGRETINLLLKGGHRIDNVQIHGSWIPKKDILCLVSPSKEENVDFEYAYLPISSIVAIIH